MSETDLAPEVVANSGYHKWLELYHRGLSNLSQSEFKAVGDTLAKSDPQTILLRPQIEAVWDPIAQANDWEPFNTLLGKIRSGN